MSLNGEKNNEEILVSKITQKVNRFAKNGVDFSCNDLENVIQSGVFKQAFIEFLAGFSHHMYHSDVKNKRTEVQHIFADILVKSRIEAVNNTLQSRFYHNQITRSIFDELKQQVPSDISDEVNKKLLKVSEYIHVLGAEQIYGKLNNIITKLHTQELLNIEEYTFLLEVWEIVVLFFQFSNHYNIQENFTLPDLGEKSLKNIRQKISSISKRVHKIYKFIFAEKYFQEKIFLPYRDTLCKQYLAQNPEKIQGLLKNLFFSMNKL